MLKNTTGADLKAGMPRDISNDWRMWDGTAKGYEGFLTDNYYTLLAVLKRDAAIGSNTGSAIPKSTEGPQ